MSLQYPGLGDTGCWLVVGIAFLKIKYMLIVKIINEDVAFRMNRKVYVQC